MKETEKPFFNNRTSGDQNRLWTIGAIFVPYKAFSYSVDVLANRHLRNVKAFLTETDGTDAAEEHLDHQADIKNWWQSAAYKEKNR